VKFHIEFAYRTDRREDLLNFLHAGALQMEGSVQVLGAWLALQTGKGYALIDTKDSKALYRISSAGRTMGRSRLLP